MNAENGSCRTCEHQPGPYRILAEVLLAVRTLAAMHGPPETHEPTDVSFHGEIWTDARGQATVSLPRDAYPPRAELEYALQPIDGESLVHLTAGLREGRFTIATDEPHVKVAWRISRRKYVGK